MINLSVHFYIFCSFFQITNAFINGTTFCKSSDPINSLMSEKFLKTV